MTSRLPYVAAYWFAGVITEIAIQLRNGQDVTAADLAIIFCALWTIWPLFVIVRAFELYGNKTIFRAKP